MDYREIYGYFHGKQLFYLIPGVEHCIYIYTHAHTNMCTSLTEIT